MYTLEFFAPDGDSVREGEFDTVEEALDRWENIGSRWFFYPIGVIFTRGGKVKVAPDELNFMEGKYKKLFTKVVREINYV